MPPDGLSPTVRIGMPLLKRLTIVSAAFGAGFALLLSLIGGILYWHQTRPKPRNAKAVRATFDGLGVDGDAQNLAFYYVIENTLSSDYKIEDKSNIILTGKLARQNALGQDSDYATIAYPVFIPAGRRVRIGITVPFPFKDECVAEQEREVGWDPASDSHRPAPSGTETIESLASRVRRKYKACEVVEDQVIVERLVKRYSVYAKWLRPEERAKLSGDVSPRQKELKAYVRKKLDNLDGFVLFDRAQRYEIDFPRGW